MKRITPSFVWGAVTIIVAVSQLERLDAFAPKPLIRQQTKQCSNPVVAFLETKEKGGEQSQDEIIGLNQQQDEQDPMPSGGDEDDPNKPLIPENSLVIAAAAIGTLAIAVHAGDYASFFQSLSEMKANMADPADFGPALNFWIFFAVGHAILQPIFWISEVLHASPGPMVGNLVPITFILGNVVAIAAFTLSKEVRNESSPICLIGSLLT